MTFALIYFNNPYKKGVKYLDNLIYTIFTSLVTIILMIINIIMVIILIIINMRVWVLITCVIIVQWNWKKYEKPWRLCLLSYNFKRFIVIIVIKYVGNNVLFFVTFHSTCKLCTFCYYYYFNFYLYTFK